MQGNMQTLELILILYITHLLYVCFNFLTEVDRPHYFTCDLFFTLQLCRFKTSIGFCLLA